MKKLLSAFFVVLLFVGAASAEVYKVGFLSRLNMTEEEFQEFVNARNNSVLSKIFSSENTNNCKDIKVRFYNSLMTMQMALDAGEIDAICLPENVAEYVMNTNQKYTISSIVITEPLTLALGFRKTEDNSLRNRFNEALFSMKADGTLSILQAKYIYDAGVDEPDPVDFEKFDNVTEAANVTIPVLVMTGEYDAINPPTEGQQVAEMLPDAQFVLVPGAEHQAYDGNLEFVLKQIDEFL